MAKVKETEGELEIERATGGDTEPGEIREEKEKKGMSEGAGRKRGAIAT